MAELTFADYDFLVELGLNRINQGCFNGEWCGSDSPIDAINPHTGKVVSKVH